MFQHLGKADGIQSEKANEEIRGLWILRLDAMAVSCGVGASWMAAALEASVLKALFFMIISYVMFIVTYLDNRYRIIPNEITFAVLLSGLGYGLAAKGLSALAVRRQGQQQDSSFVF